MPIINENDTVATEEIRYGDNDRLAARVAQLVMADALILLSDVDGLYTPIPAEANANTFRKCEDHRRDPGDGRRDSLRYRQWRHGDQGAGGTHRDACGVLDGHCQRRDRTAAGRLAAEAMHRVSCEGTPAAARKQWLAGVLEVAANCGSTLVR